MRFDVLQCQHSRLFHDIAQISGQRQTTTLATAETRFNKKNLTTDSCPCQPCNHTGIFITLILVTRIFRSAQEFI